MAEIAHLPFILSKFALPPTCCTRVIGGLLASANRPFLIMILLVRKESWMLTMEEHSSDLSIARSAGIAPLLDLVRFYM